ncbi:MAG: redoxin domain-containing protein [Bacteroidota bacterium]
MASPAAAQPHTIPRIGEQAPAFQAATTQGGICFPEDYVGSRVIIFSHPAGFTPVCTSEIMTFAAMEPGFHPANRKPVSLSVDGLYGHIARLRTISSFAVATRADRRPGDDVMSPPAGFRGVAAERMQGTAHMKCHDWFFRTKKLSEEELFAAIRKTNKEG